MPQITFNERVLDLREEPSEDHPGTVTTIDALAKQVDAFASGTDAFRTINVALGSDWTFIFQNIFTVLQTGGGLVRNPKGEFLLIKRLGWWDLPKGKLDEGERIEACALREVLEETGVRDLHIIRPLLVTYHCYSEKEKLILKENHWFLMESGYAGELKPQTEEDITDCTWAGRSAMDQYWEGMYRAVQQVISSALS
jgi:ADP-ribose pyrophosphatase YjhB (NUDIX family)